MSWLKNVGSGLVVAALGFIAFMLAASVSREKASAQKWKDRAVTAAEDDVVAGTTTAKAALRQAKLHDVRAREAVKRTKARLNQIGERDESMADIVSSWRKPKRVRDDADADA